MTSSKLDNPDYYEDELLVTAARTGPEAPGSPPLPDSARHDDPIISPPSVPAPAEWETSDGRPHLDCRIKPKDLCVTTRQLATLLRAGMPLAPALRALQEQLQDRPLEKVIDRIARQVNAGTSLARALRDYPDIFSELYVNMVKAGQAGGVLEEVLEKLADILEKRAQLAGKLRAALAYPVLMAIAAVGVVAFLLAFVIPDIAGIFLEMNRTLPRPTLILIAVSTFFRDNLPALALLLCVIILILRFYLRSESGRLHWHRLKLKLPLFGRLFRKVETIRFCRTLGVMLASGIPILEALEITRGVIRNRTIAAGLEQVADSISRGHSIAYALKQTGLFEPIVHHTVAVGEMSGNIEEQLTTVADGCDREVQSIVQSLTALLEPVILLIMGLVVGFIVLAILLPIFEINQMI